MLGPIITILEKVHKSACNLFAKITKNINISKNLVEIKAESVDIV